MQCLECKIDLDVDSRFCKRCGKALPVNAEGKFSFEALMRQVTATIDELKALEPNTALILSDPSEARRSCSRILQIAPNSDFAKLANFMLELARGHENQKNLADESAALTLGDAEQICEWSLELPDLELSNGLAACGKISTPEKRKSAERFFVDAREGLARALNRLLEGEQRLAKGFLINGETRAKRQGMTFYDFTAEADAAYAAYQAGQRERAFAEFQRLRVLNPNDSYTRCMLAAIHQENGEWRDALLQCLMGCSLEPVDPHLTCNLLRILLVLGLYAPAVEVAQYFRQYTSPDAETGVTRQIEQLGKAATKLSGALVALLAGCTSKDVSTSVPDVITDAAAQVRAWLPTPEGGDGLAKEEATKVFISYRRQESSDLARRVREVLLEDADFRVFLDERAIASGEQFASSIARELKTSQLVVFVVPGAAGIARLKEKGDFVRRELQYAANHSIPIVPLLLDDRAVPEPAELPSSLREMFRINCHRVRSLQLREDLLKLKWQIKKIAAIRQLQITKEQQESEEMMRLLETDPAEHDRRLQAMLADARDDLEQFVEVPGKRGQGVPRSVVQIYGTWSCAVIDSQGETNLEILIERRRGNPFEAKCTTRSRSGRKQYEFEGSWAWLYKENSEDCLGFRLIYLDERKAFVHWDILIHAESHEGFIATAPGGARFICRNVDPREGDF